MRRRARSNRVQSPARRGPQRAVAQRSAPPPLERLLALPAVDRLLSGLLARPHTLQIAGLLLGLVLVAITLRALPPLGGPRLPAAPGAAHEETTAVSAPTMEPDTAAQAAIALVAAYNQASIAAADLGRADGLAPYLAPDGAAWAAVQAEYARRAARGETHDPALAHWGVLRAAVDAEHATVETQEQRDDRTIVAGQVISSRRGILTRNIYTLAHAHDAGGWMITTIMTEVVIG